MFINVVVLLLSPDAIWFFLWFGLEKFRFGLVFGLSLINVVGGYHCHMG